MTQQVATQDLDKSVQAWRSALLSGKSDAVTRFVRKPSEADAAGILAGARVLAREEGTFSNGIAVAVYALSSSGMVKGREIAAEIGVVESRVSQLKLQGEVIAKLGLPEGWRTPITTLQLQQIVGGKLGSAAQLREFVENGGKVDTIRRAISASVETALADREERQAQITAARKEAAAKARAAREGTLGSNPTGKSESVESGPPVAVEAISYAEQIASSLADLNSVCGYLAARVGDLTDAQSEQARMFLTPLVVALSERKSEQAPEVSGVKVSDAPKPGPARKR